MIGSTLRLAIGVFAAAALATPAAAQVRSVTVGIDTTCPYGLVA